jgi:hypothetical protein
MATGKPANSREVLAEALRPGRGFKVTGNVLADDFLLTPSSKCSWKPEPLSAIRQRGSRI